MQVTLYFKNSDRLDEFTEKLRIEIIGSPTYVEKIVKVIREEIKGWIGWQEA